MSTTQESQELRELTQRDLRGVKLDHGRIDALALIGRAIGVSNPKPQRAILCKCLQKCPELQKHSTRCYFGRKDLAPALNAEGAYLLILTLGDDLSRIENACLVVGEYMMESVPAASELLRFVLGSANAARELLKKECVGAEPDSDEHEFHEAALRAQAKDTALLNKLTAYVRTLTQTSQLRKELGMPISTSLQRLVERAMEDIEELTSQQGTIDAIDILKRYNHSASEAAKMASSFGKFLKAASAPANYTPNRRTVQFGRARTSCNDVRLYNPRLHADIITAASESLVST